MTEEEKKEAAAAEFEAELLRFRALRIGCPVYGHFYSLLHMQQAQKVLAEAVNTPARQCGYFNKRTGAFSVSPVRQ